MGAFDGHLLCTDFDGTLAVNAEISEANRDAIEYFMSEGGLFTVCTGRTFEFIKKKLTFSPNAPLITVNGSVIRHQDTGELIHSWSMDGGILEFCNSLIGELGSYIDFLYFVAEGICEPIELLPSELKAAMESYRSLSFNKAVLRIEEEKSDDIFARVIERAGESYYVSRSWIAGIELQAPHSSKGAAVRYLRELLGERVLKVICVGDYENDIPMLEAADVSYAVSDGAEAAKAAADRLTVACREDAIAHIIRELER